MSANPGRYWNASHAMLSGALALASQNKPLTSMFQVPDKSPAVKVEDSFDSRNCAIIDCCDQLLVLELSMPLATDQKQQQETAEQVAKGHARTEDTDPNNSW